MLVVVVVLEKDHSLHCRRLVAWCLFNGAMVQMHCCFLHFLHILVAFTLARFIMANGAAITAAAAGNSSSSAFANNCTALEEVWGPFSENSKK